MNITAEVTRILPAKDGSKASQIYYEYVDFYKLSGVNYLWFSAVGRFARLQAALGKAPDEVWSDDDRRKFFSFYARFSALYGDKSAQDLAGRMTTGDAILLFLDIYGYDQVKSYTQTELKNGFLQLHQAFSVKKGSNPLKELNPLKGLLGR